MAGAAGIVTRTSDHTFEETLGRLEAAVQARGLTVFARFDHAAAARAVGLEMPATTVVVFGSPRGGTPLMLAEPLVALELPLRALVGADGAGVVSVSYADPSYVGARFGLSDALVGNIAIVASVVAEAL